MRAFLPVCDEAVGGDAGEDAGGPVARVVEDLRAADRKLVQGGDLLGGETHAATGAGARA